MLGLAGMKGNDVLRQHLVTAGIGRIKQDENQVEARKKGRAQLQILRHSLAAVVVATCVVSIPYVCVGVFAFAYAAICLQSLLSHKHLLL